jgi:hypothetical protein
MGGVLRGLGISKQICFKVEEGILSRIDAKSVISRAEKSEP